jgi:hypothetical protein
VAEKSEALRATIGKFAQELRAKEQEDADTAQICDACKEFAADFSETRDEARHAIKFGMPHYHKPTCTYNAAA